MRGKKSEYRERKPYDGMELSKRDRSLRRATRIDHCPERENDVETSDGAKTEQVGLVR